MPLSKSTFVLIEVLQGDMLRDVHFGGCCFLLECVVHVRFSSEALEVSARFSGNNQLQVGLIRQGATSLSLYSQGFAVCGAGRQSRPGEVPWIRSMNRKVPGALVKTCLSNGNPAF